MALIINAFQSLLEGTGLDLRFSSSPQPFWDHAAGCASSWLFLLTGPGGSLLTSGAGRRKQPRGPKDRRLHDPKGVARTPAGGPEMPQAQRRGISSILTSSSRQTAAHRHPLWTYKTPHLVRQGPISACGAPQPPAQRTKAASRCGCLTKSVIVDFFQGHLDRCHFRRTFFDLFWLTVLIQSFFI